MASKNQRSGPKLAQKENVCEKGHDRIWVNIAHRGRKDMRPLCACDGFAPISKEKS